MKNIYFTVLFIIAAIPILSQVGIGSASPNTNSILDLTNGNNQVLLLPAIVSPSSSTKGSIYFNTLDSTLNYHNGIDYNSLSAWNYKFNGNNNLYTNENVGIGLSNPQTSMHVKGNGEVIELEGTDNAYLSFYPNGHGNGRKGFLGFKGSGTNDVSLKNETTVGNVIVDFANTSGKLNVRGKVQERGYDLVPQGLIFMWNGSSIPAGWALCDGGTYPKLDGQGNVTVPDLRERFIVGAGTAGGAVFVNDNSAIIQQSNTNNTSVGGSGAAVYNVNNVGSNNENKHTLTNSEMRGHTHGSGSLSGIANASGSEHYHEFGFDTGVGGGYGTAHDAVMTKISGAGQSGGTPEANVASNTDNDGAHTHFISLTGSTDNKGSGQSHENRPPYYALAFIIKL